MIRPLTIVTTGSNRGLGKCLVEILAKTTSPRPLSIWATSRSGADLKIQPSAPNKIHYAPLDVTDKSSIKTLINSILQHDGKIDVLINNAGVCDWKDFTPRGAK